MAINTLNIKRMAEMAVERTVRAIDSLPTPPATPDNLAATARTFGILVQWSRVSGADGYLLSINDDQDFSEVDTQVKVPGQDSLEYFYSTGNVALTRYFRVAAFKGSEVSNPSSVVSATSTNVEAGASQTNAPGSDTFDDNEKTLLTATLTTTGRNVIAIAQGRVHDPAGKQYTFRLKEDGVTIHSVVGFSTDEIETTLFKLSTPAAGSHTYIMTGDNDTDATTLSVDALNMIVFEVPFSTSVESSTSPPEPPAPQQSVEMPGTFKIGPDYRPWEF